MYTSPVILLVGQAGSGKDTVAGFMVKNHGAIAIAHADPMKRIAKILFDFTEQQLWGPSDCRNAIDPRFLGDGANQRWINAYDTIAKSEAVGAWIKEVLPGSKADLVRGSLSDWMNLVQSETYWKGKPLTPRYALQTLGTEWGRRQSKNMWTDAAINLSFKILAGGFRYDRTVGIVADDKYAGPDRVVITDGRFRNEVVNVRRVSGAVIRIDSPSIDTAAIEAAGVKGHVSEKEQQGLPSHFFTGFLMNDKAKGLAGCEASTAQLIAAMDGNSFSAGYPEHPYYAAAGIGIPSDRP